jgi:hypothetical protein
MTAEALHHQNFRRRDGDYHAIEEIGSLDMSYAL